HRPLLAADRRRAAHGAALRRRLDRPPLPGLLAVSGLAAHRPADPDPVSRAAAFPPAPPRPRALRPPRPRQWPPHSKSEAPDALHDHREFQERRSAPALWTFPEQGPG